MIIEVRLSNIVAEGTLRDKRETETYLVRTDAEENARTVRRNTSPLLPHLGDVDPDTGLKVSELNVTRMENCKPSNQVFTYNAVWATPEIDVEFVENPLDRPPEISWEGLEFSVVELFDKAGTPYRNSFGDLYQDIPPKVVGGGSLVITRNESGNPATTVANASFTVNLNPWFGVPAKLGRMGKIVSRKLTEQAYTFWQTSYPIDLKRDNWRHKAVDAGFNVLVGGVRQRDYEFFTDESGAKRRVPRSTLTLLNGTDGTPLVGSGYALFPADGFVQHDEIDWNALGLPNPFAA